MSTKSQLNQCFDIKALLLGFMSRLGLTDRETGKFPEGPADRDGFGSVCNGPTVAAVRNRPIVEQCRGYQRPIKGSEGPFPAN